MNKTQLIEQVAEKTNFTKKDTATITEAILETITNSIVSGEKVSLIGFGNFEVRKRAARTGRNPQTNEPVNIPESKAPAFKPSKNLKELVNQ